MRFRKVFLPVLLCPFLLVGHLSAQSGQGYVKAKVNPGRAGVFIDGKYVGPAANFRIARKYAVAAGDHEVKLVEPRFQEIVTKVSVKAGKTSVISETMKAVPLATPPFGLLRIKGPDKFAPVYINNQFYGHAGEFNNSVQGLRLKPGDYTVRVDPLSGGTGHEEKVSIQADKISVVNVK